MKIVFLVMLVLSINSYSQNQTVHNPICAGYYADPTIIKFRDTFFIYATIDPWGGKELGVLLTKDFIHFTTAHINWPTKKDCTNPGSGPAMVWAPSIRRAGNGKFYMYVSVSNEIWVGVSDHPLGPWKNAKENNEPLVPGNLYPGVHNIDPDCFIDSGGSAYLYWGTGFNWVNGHCMAVRLKEDMITFDGIPVDITPPHYFEAPHMLKREGKYYLMYSYGKAIDATYQIRYSTGHSPFGPWTEGNDDPILFTSADGSTIGPGHHTVFQEKGQYYILYHRIHPQNKEFVLRELCVDSLKFGSEEEILRIKPAGIVAF